MDSSFLALGEVETRGSTHLDGKPLPQFKPSASRRDATFEEKKKIEIQNFARVLVVRLPIELFIKG